MNLKRLVLSFVISTFIFATPLFAIEKEKDPSLNKEQRLQEDTLLFFDENIPRNVDFAFDIEESKRIRPKPNDFELVHFAPMSNKIGERWILITVRNNAIGHRILKSEHLVATFANGDQANPVGLDESVESGQTLTKQIYFGINKFPIVYLEIQPQ